MITRRNIHLIDRDIFRMQQAKIEEQKKEISELKQKLELQLQSGMRNYAE